MRSFSAKSVSLATVMAISLLLVGQSTPADEPVADTPVVETATVTPPPLRLWVDDRDPERTEQILQVLDSDLTNGGLNFEDEPLEGVIAFLREEYSLQIQLDSVGLDDLGIGPDEPVTISIQNVKLSSAFRRMLKPLELEYVVQDGILLVTSEDAALIKLSVAVYPVGDLLNNKPDWDALTDAIVSTIESDTWAENGGGEAEVRPYPQRSALVVLQTTQIHEQIAGLLAALRECQADSGAKPLPDSKPHGESGGSGCGGSS